ncbi:hypothetical protein [Pseudobacter ginsenosidimutans]|uniref:Uncharacterized protein n=1 Tax=Pseudobacter ginsenosidimutans TaxID=661488 RepID=A0A4Q7MEP8_9BACT|nr:hypothetical protein [Pseudobacter ginsenosidimutans]QEC45241.1 hypothetical protein FSB84_27430 [Pseudobacter ginsenosidimutans]RZS65508.1 hypothetical protein EV199_5682 [Pseudobacter ginsenosidimutans]
MGFFKKIFGKSAPETAPIEKDKVPVYPMIKDARWQGISLAVHLPFVKLGDNLDLAIVFPQDAGDRFEYITPHDLQIEAIKNNFEKWQSNIDEYPYEIEISEQLNRRVIFASGSDHSSEKILSSAFLAEACRVLNTDKLIISAPRRRCLMITSYYENFQMLETFFHLHFIAYREDDYGNEVITEMVFVSDNNKVQYAVPLGFRINMYEKDGQRKLVYSTMDDLFDENGQINFQNIIERNKIPVSYP